RDAIRPKATAPAASTASTTSNTSVAAPMGQTSQCRARDYGRPLPNFNPSRSRRSRKLIGNGTDSSANSSAPGRHLGFLPSKLAGSSAQGSGWLCLRLRLHLQLLARGEHRLAHHRLPNLVGDLLGELGVAAEQVADVVPALAQPHLAVAEPGATLVDDPRLDGSVQNTALVGDALVVEKVELHGTEGSGHLVLDHPHPDPPADHVQALLDGVDLANVESDRGIELECPAPGGDFGIAEHHPDLLPQLVDEDHDAI